MNPELSLRVTPLLPYLQENMEIKAYWALQDRLLKAESFDALSKRDKRTILDAEKSGE